MNTQQQRRNYQSFYRSDIDYQFYERRINHQSENETSTAHKLIKKRSSSQFSSLDQKADMKMQQTSVAIQKKMT